MREPVTIYADPIKVNRKYMLRQDDGRWYIMSKTGQGDWVKVQDAKSSPHKFITEEAMREFVFANGLYEESMDEDLAGV